MAQELIVVLAVVVPDEPPENRGRLHDLRGRELPGVPGSWVTRVAVHAPHEVEAVLSRSASSTRDTPTSATGPGEAEAGTGASGLTAEEVEHELDLDCGAAAGDD